jgi:uncharacterized repeat protein (TIGR04138 family)
VDIYQIDNVENCVELPAKEIVRMSTTGKLLSRKLRFHPDAYRFVFEGLKHAQLLLSRSVAASQDEEPGQHISGEQLLNGIRALAIDQFGPMTLLVFRHWGIRTTEDFGRIVFDLIDRGEMSKTDRDQLSDFVDVYDFEEVFSRQYRIDTCHVFGPLSR